jgi:hypothetical protein
VNALVPFELKAADAGSVEGPAEQLRHLEGPAEQL